MIPQQTFESFPVFSDTGTKIKPDDAKYSAGFQQADVLPAEWMNWEWNKASKGVTDLNRGLDSVEKEIIAVLTEYGISPAEATEDQLKQALIKMRPQIVTCSTAAATAAKTISITGGVLKAGNIYAISMTHGNSAADPTLSINGGTAYPMYDTKGNKLKSGAWQDNTYIIVLFTGTRYIMILIDDTIENGNMNAITSNAVSCILASSTTISGPKLGAGGQIKIMFTADISGTDTSTGLSLTYNGSSIPVKAAKDGSLVDFKAYEVSSGVYKYLQAYTTLELVYDSANSRFVIVGNPVVISTSDFLVYSNGFFKSLKEDVLSEWENIDFPLNTEVTMLYDGVVVVGRNGSYSSMIKVIRGNSEMEYGGTSSINGVLQTLEITVQKGDILKTTHNGWDFHKVAYYKNRDYSNR